MFMIPVSLGSLLCDAATMKNSKSSVMFPGLNGHNNMDTTAFSEGDLLLQVRLASFYYKRPAACQFHHFMPTLILLTGQFFVFSFNSEARIIFTSVHT